MAIICNIKNIFKDDTTNTVDDENLNADQTKGDEQLLSEAKQLNADAAFATVPMDINQAGDSSTSSVSEKLAVAVKSRAKTQGLKKGQFDPTTLVLSHAIERSN